MMRKTFFLHFVPKYLLSFALSLLAVYSSAKNISSLLTVDMTTDKACYIPGQSVVFVLSGNVPANTMVRYRHGSAILETHKLSEVMSNNKWSWTPPMTDYQGYLVEVYTETNDQSTILGTVAVDVSSDWKRFPRYGFVADFDNAGGSIDKNANIKNEMAYLNRLHINGVQFQDWLWMHHKPVKLDAHGSLIPWYQDISNRWVGVEFVKNYIAEQHKYGMKSIFYNLCFGAWKNAENDGVKTDWALLKKDGSGNFYQDYHGLPSSWASNIYLQVPGNMDWQQYMAERNTEIYSHFDFDGFQIDQLGYRGDVYDARHKVVDLPASYKSFIQAMKSAHPDKDLIMNAVSGYGADNIVSSDVDFCYNEVWGNDNGYGGVSEADFANLLGIIQVNDKYSDHQRQTVFAAYINYDKADNGGSGDKMVNTPGVLLTDAVIAALGGSHLEMGDHMLTREYFPAAPLSMSDALKTAMVRYYDFQTAYQNFLRGTTSKAAYLPVVSTSSNYSVNAWPPKSYSITTFAKKVGNCDVLHFLNFLNTDDLSWRDVWGTRTFPDKCTGIPITVTANRKIDKVWMATPDIHAGAVQELAFTQNGDDVSFVLPSLEYWTMVVMEGPNDEDHIYITGEAVQLNGHAAYDLAYAVPMTNNGEGKVYKVTTYLKANELFKFTNGRDWRYCKSYCAEYKDYQFNSFVSLAHITTLGEDFKFMVPEAGYYDITIDLEKMRVYVTKAEHSSGLSAIIADKSASGEFASWYSVSGVPVDKPRKGIYVNRGKKVLF